MKPTELSKWVREKLSRITSSGNFVPEIDGLRFFAISGVILLHLNGYYSFNALGGPPSHSHLYRTLSSGFSGVPLFFVISGFILSLPFAAHLMKRAPALPLGKYYLRRLTRLEPPYISNILLLFALRVLVKGESAHRLLPHLLASLCYTHDFFFNDQPEINTVAWSLEVEIRFYLLAPLLCQVFRIRPAFLRRPLIIGAIMVGTTLKFCDVSELSFLYNAHYFLVGFLLSDIYLNDWDRTPGKSRGWDLFAAPFWAYIFFQAYLDPYYNHLMLPFVIFFAYMGAFRGKEMNLVVSNPWLITIGGMCYTLYLYHFLLTTILGKLTLRFPRTGVYALDLLAQMAVMIPGILVSCSLLFAFWEKPFMRRSWPQETWRFLKGLRNAEGP